MAVRGSLDHPPIVIRTAWWKIILRYSAIAALLGVVFGTETEHAGASDTVAAIIDAFVFLFCIAMFLHAFLHSRIEISPAGISYVSLFRRRSCSWAETSEIHLARAWSPHAQTMCVRLCEEAADPAKARKANAGKTLAQIPGSGWPIKPEALAHLLNVARRRWAGAHPEHEEILGEPVPDIP